MIDKVNLNSNVLKNSSNAFSTALGSANTFQVIASKFKPKSLGFISGKSLLDINHPLTNSVVLTASCAALGASTLVIDAMKAGVRTGKLKLAKRGMVAGLIVGAGLSLLKQGFDLLEKYLKPSR